jgi:hypothetical protein
VSRLDCSERRLPKPRIVVCATAAPRGARRMLF